MAKKALLATFLAVVAATCTDPSAPIIDGVQAELTSEGLLAHNRRADTIYYQAIERVIAARVDWAPCFGEGPCPHIEPGGSKTIPYEQLMWGIDGSEEALFYWWLMVPDGNGQLRPDSLRVILARR
jgi:hypothetical protein